MTRLEDIYLDDLIERLVLIAGFSLVFNVLLGVVVIIGKHHGLVPEMFLLTPP